VLRGDALFTGGGVRASAHWAIFTPGESRPAIAHFNASFADRPPYTSEVMRLQKVRGSRWPIVAATILARATIDWPYLVTERARTVLRPVYRTMFGTRAIHPSPRV
jgi:hypothetical protein